MGLRALLRRLHEVSADAPSEEGARRCFEARRRARTALRPATLMASGFSGQSVTFHGYLPIDKLQRANKVKELEGVAERHSQTQMFIETPFRNDSILEEILKSCKLETRLFIACDLTSESEFIQTKSIREWKLKIPQLHKRPAIFMLFKK